MCTTRLKQLEVFTLHVIFVSVEIFIGLISNLDDSLFADGGSLLALQYYKL